MGFKPSDHAHMHRALSLARRGQGRVEPNPMVGCVLVRGGRQIGEGFHQRYGGPHAEIEALRQAGDKARGATAYVTLEPCCHFGKTPPCTDALVRAGVVRVVVAMRDPYPEVDGGGIRSLRKAGARVQVGLNEEEARELNAPFVTRVTHGRPYVILKWAQSLDGKIATRTGESKWISGPAARNWVHVTRARVDGILVGVGTVLADNPRLVARGVPVRRVAARVILDSRLRIPITAKVVETADAVRTIVFTTRRGMEARAAKARRLCSAGLDVIAAPSRAGRASVDWVARWLGRSGFTNLLVEGGGEVLGTFLDQRLADEAMVFVSPRLIGGRGSVSALGGVGVSSLKEAPLFGRFKVRRVGDDLLFRVRFPD